jgi:AraC-like DNA-binding protein
VRDSETVANVYREWEPPASWRHVVSCCWEQRTDEDLVQRVVPDAHADVVIHETGEIDLVGLYDEVDMPFLAAGTWIRGIRFRPEAVAAAFRVDASSLRNRSVALADVVGARLARRVVDPRACDAWISSLEPSVRTQHAVRLLATHPVNITADALGLTARQLHRVLVADVGLAPKTFQNVLRLQRFLAATERLGRLADAAAEAGYADQAHMTREVRALAGITPRRLVDERNSSAQRDDDVATVEG